jgi:hypothetical protein
MTMQENLAEFELNQSLVGLCFQSTWSNGWAFLDSIYTSQQRKFLESSSLYLLYNSSIERVEAAWINILVLRARSANIFGSFHTALFNQSFIKFTVCSDTSPDNRVIIRIRDMCAAICSSGWWGGPGGTLCLASIAFLSITKFQVSTPFW